MSNLSLTVPVCVCVHLDWYRRCWHIWGSLPTSGKGILAILQGMTPTQVIFSLWQVDTNTSTTSYVRKLWRKVHADYKDARKLYSKVKSNGCIEPGEREWSRGRIQMLGNIQNTGRNLWDFHSKRQLSGEREKGIFNNFASEANCFSPLSYRGLKMLSHHLEQICKTVSEDACNKLCPDSYALS